MSHVQYDWNKNLLTFNIRIFAVTKFLVVETDNILIIILGDILVMYTRIQYYCAERPSVMTAFYYYFVCLYI